ncbi:MAG TPA: SufE family protein [Candidatus Marinimicrobia bacterium]|nr:SufE family protein [Candidatus Neomarinimicrobiota bacterium]
MNTIQDTMTLIKDEFSIFNEPQEKYVLLVDLGKKSSGLPPEKRTDKNKVNGCISQAWLIADKQTDDTYNFQTDSDAMIVKGLLFILQRLFNGQRKEDIVSIDGQNILDHIGLEGTISNQRTNGFGAAINKIQHELVA